jgi:hypothetical protein
MKPYRGQRAKDYDPSIAAQTQPPVSDVDWEHTTAVDSSDSLALVPIALKPPEDGDTLGYTHPHGLDLLLETPPVLEAHDE